MHLTPTTRNSAAQRLEKISFDTASGLCPSRGSGGGLHRNPDRMGIGRSCQTMGRHGPGLARPPSPGVNGFGFPHNRIAADNAEGVLEAGRETVGEQPGLRSDGAAAPPAPGRPSGASTAALPCLETGPVRPLLPVNLGPVPDLSGTFQHAPTLLRNRTGGITRRCRRRCRWSFHGRVLLPDNRFGKGKRTRP